MIGWLRGTVVEKTSDGAVIEAAGVGYRVFCSSATAGAIPGPGGPTEVHVHTHVRENEIALFAFATRLEKDLFERLIAVSDIGPRKAIGILSGVDPAGLVGAIRDGNLAVLTSLPGVGKKTAERLVVEMKDRLKGLDAAGARADGVLPSDARRELVSALVNLGYRPAQADRAVEALRGRLRGGEPFAVLIREALAEVKKTG
ncbi:MAG: Holliday junction branch migration protein RuvA [Deltaproteobacteria bacterium]|nr:Holliday junction branch migration protein RuvA [Deltaproteobacteria bacterium]